MDFVPRMYHSEPQLLFLTGETKVLIQILETKATICVINVLKARQFCDAESKVLSALYHVGMHISSDIKTSPCCKKLHYSRQVRSFFTIFLGHSTSFSQVA